MKGASLERLDRALFWLSGTALLALAAALQSGFLLFTALPLWGLSGWHSRRGGQPVSRAASAGLAALVFALLLLALSTDPRNFIEYFSMGLGGLVLVKLFDQRTVSDRSMLFCVCAALVIGAALLHSTLVIGLTLLAFMLQAFRAAGLLQIARAEERGGITSSSQTWAPASRAVWGGALASGVVMVAIFILMPRGFMAAPAGLAGNSADTGESGFDTEIELNASGRIQESFDPVLEVRPESDAEEFARLDHVYLRGAVLDEYAGGRQTFSLDREFSSVRFESRRGEIGPLGNSASKHEITIVGEQPERLFSVGRPGRVHLLEAEGVVVQSDPSTREMRLELGEVGRYTVESEAISRRVEPGEAMPAATYPERVSAYASELLSGIGDERDPSARHTPDDERIVRFFERHLRTNYQYSTERPPPAPGEDPLESFLFAHQTGHCEYFATALTALTRSVGIEARVITGFLTSERLGDGAFVARNAHAHAWVEAHIAPGVWMRFDASPPGDVAEAQRAPTGPLVAARNAWAWVSDLWVRSVVSYDSGSQRTLFGGGYDRFLERASVRGRRNSGNGMRGVLRALGAGVAAFALTVLVGHVAPVVVRSLRERDGSRNAGGIGSAMRRADRMLAKAGVGREISTPVRTHARAVSETNNRAGAAYDELAALHYRLRYGGAEDSASADELLARLRSALRGDPA